MIAIGPTTRIFVYTAATDMRKGFCGLSGLVKEHFKADLLVGSSRGGEVAASMYSLVSSAARHNIDVWPAWTIASASLPADRRTMKSCCRTFGELRIRSPFACTGTLKRSRAA